MVPVFFPFWFGMIVGDIGYALLFYLVGRWLSGYVKRNEPLVIDLFALKLKPQVIGKLVHILNWMVFWTVVWGVIYGEFFGTFLEHLGVFGTPEHPGLIPILIHRIDTAKTANLLILLSVAFGVVLVFFGLALRAYLGLKHRHMAHFWEGVGYLGGLVGVLALAASYLGNLQAGWLQGLMYLGFGVFLLAVLMSRIWLMIPEIFTQAGHILSHIRIYAVGAAGGILAGLLTDVGFALAERLGLLGVLLGLLVAGVLHLLILLLTTLGHMLQPIRCFGWSSSPSSVSTRRTAGPTGRSKASVRRSKGGKWDEEATGDGSSGGFRRVGFRGGGGGGLRRPGPWPHCRGHGLGRGPGGPGHGRGPGPDRRGGRGGHRRGPEQLRYRPHLPAPARDPGDLRSPHRLHPQRQALGRSRGPALLGGGAPSR